MRSLLAQQLTNTLLEICQICLEVLGKPLIRQTATCRANDILPVNQSQSRAMAELVAGFHARLRLAFDRLLELLSHQRVDGGFIPGEEEPAIGIGLAIVRVLPQGREVIAFRVDRERVTNRMV